MYILNEHMSRSRSNDEFSQNLFGGQNRREFHRSTRHYKDDLSDRRWYFLCNYFKKSKKLDRQLAISFSLLWLNTMAKSEELWWISYVFDELDVWFIEATAATYYAPISHHNYHNLKQWWLFAPFDNHFDRRLNVRAVTNKFIHDSNGTYECVNAKHL